MKNKFSIWAFGEDYNDSLTYGELSERWNNLHGDIFKLPTQWDLKEFDWQMTVYKKCLPEYYKIHQPERLSEKTPKGDAIV